MAFHRRLYFFRWWHCLVEQLWFATIPNLVRYRYALNFIMHGNIRTLIITLDIPASKLFIGVPVGISATSLCITRRLVMIASSTAVTITQRQKRIALAVDLFLGIGMPVLVMALHYIVQAHRFDIIEGYGCQPVTWPGVPALFAVTWWSPLLTIIAAGYGGKQRSSISQCRVELM